MFCFHAGTWHNISGMFFPFVFASSFFWSVYPRATWNSEHFRSGILKLTITSHFLKKIVKYPKRTAGFVQEFLNMIQPVWNSQWADISSYKPCYKSYRFEQPLDSILLYMAALKATTKYVSKSCRIMEWNFEPSNRHLQSQLCLDCKVIHVGRLLFPQCKKCVMRDHSWWFIGARNKSVSLH